jgi:hypothetical protein
MGEATEEIQSTVNRSSGLSGLQSGELINNVFAEDSNTSFGFNFAGSEVDATD